MREAAGRRLARPLRAAELVDGRRLWAALLTVYLMLDRPDELGDVTAVDLPFGIFVALGGCLAIASAAAEDARVSDAGRTGTGPA